MRDLKANPNDPSVVVFGAPGVNVSSPMLWRGSDDVDEVLRNAQKYTCELVVDLPFLLPLYDNQEYPIAVEDAHYLIVHRTKERGEEEFSTLDTTELPRFSALMIRGQGFVDEVMDSEFQKRSPNSPGYYRSYVLILRVLKKLDAYLGTNTGFHLPEPLPQVSYRMRYIDETTDPPIVRAERSCFYSGTTKIQDPRERDKVHTDALKHFLSQSIHIDAFAQDAIAPKVAGKSFLERVFLTTHDFCYYCRQAPEAIGSLVEERIRDLYLIPIKVVFTSAEGESYHFDGKLDFKITNLDAKHEFVTGQFKWWRGAKSAEEIFHQAVRKHATGQEAEIHAILLTKNKDSSRVFEGVKRVFAQQPECDGASYRDRECPTGSRERVGEFRVNVRGNTIPLCVMLADLYHQTI